MSRGKPSLAARGASGHTPSMTLKNASLWALIGTLLLAILLVGDLVIDLLSIMRGLIAMMVLLAAFIRAFAAVTVAVFFYIYHRTQA